MIEGISHRPGFRVAGVEKDDHQIGQVDDVVGDTQGSGALSICVEARRVDQDLAPQLLAGTGLELQIGVDAPAFPRGTINS